MEHRVGPRAPDARNPWGYDYPAWVREIAERYDVTDNDVDAAVSYVAHLLSFGDAYGREMGGLRGVAIAIVRACPPDWAACARWYRDYDGFDGM